MEPLTRAARLQKPLTRAARLQKRVRRQLLSLRQSRHQGHSFCAPDQRSEPRRTRPLLANCPNHGDRAEDQLRAVFRLSRPTFSDATEPRPFWYGCWKLDNSMSWRTPEGNGFERIPLWRSAPGSNRLVQCVCFRPQSGPVIRRLRPAGRGPDPDHRAARSRCASRTLGGVPAYARLVAVPRALFAEILRRIERFAAEAAAVLGTRIESDERRQPTG